jgi:hypothetical protein
VKKEILVVVPTRGRPDNAARLAKAHRDLGSGPADLLFVVDHDDPERDAYLAAVPPWGSVAVQSAQRLGPTLNTWALTASEDYQAVGFLGDDHLPRTTWWDAVVWGALEDGAPAVVYGDDGLQGAALPTAVFLPSRMVRALGFMSPPGLVHLYIDNYWLELGQALGCLRYLPGVMIEHLHPAAGKAAWDAGYQAANNGGRDLADREAWRRFRDGGDFDAAVARVRKEYGR